MDTLPALQTALSFYMDNDFPEKALPVLELWIKEHPDNIDAKVGKGLLQAQLKQFDSAVKTLDAALEEASGGTKSNIRSQLAGVFVEMGEYEKALGHIDDALDNDRDSGRFLYQKATIYMQMNQHENAISIFDELLSRNEWNLSLIHISEPTRPY